MSYKQEMNAIRDKQRGIVKTVDAIRYATENNQKRERERQMLRLADKVDRYLTWLNGHGLFQKHLSDDDFVWNQSITAIVEADRKSLEDWAEAAVAATMPIHEKFWHAQHMMTLASFSSKDLLAPEEKIALAEFLILDDPHLKFYQEAIREAQPLKV